MARKGTTAQPAAAESDQPDEGRFAPPIEGEVIQSTEGAIIRTGRQSNDLDSSMAVALSEAEINQQIATAHRFPRSVQRSIESMIELATMDTETALECNYSLPRGRDPETGKAKAITGPSIRLAELIAQQWGNNRVAARVIATDRAEKFVEAEGIYHDLETNSAVCARVRRRISDKKGGLFNDDMINVTANAASSIALRNAILRGVPKPVWRKVYAAVVRVISGDLKTLGARRVELLTRFKAELGIEPRIVYSILSVKGENDIGLDELVVAAGFYTALRNNEITVEDLLKEAGATPAQVKTLAGAYGAAGGSPDHKLEPKAEPKADHDPQTGEVLKDPGAGVDTTDEVADADPNLTKAISREEVAAARKIEPDPKAIGASGLPEWAAAGQAYTLSSDPWVDGMKRAYVDGVSKQTAGKHAGLPEFPQHPPKPDEAGAAAEPAAAEADDGFPGDQPNISSGAEDRVDHEADAALNGPRTEEPQAADGRQAPTSEELEARPPDFDVFEAAVDEATTWQGPNGIKNALVKLQKTPGFQEQPPHIQLDARTYAYNAVSKLVAAGSETVDYRADPSLFVLWLDVADPAEVRPAVRMLIRSQAYKDLSDGQRDMIADAVTVAESRG